MRSASLYAGIMSDKSTRDNFERLKLFIGRWRRSRLRRNHLFVRNCKSAAVGNSFFSRIDDAKLCREFVSLLSDSLNFSTCSHLRKGRDLGKNFIQLGERLRFITMFFKPSLVNLR